MSSIAALAFGVLAGLGAVMAHARLWRERDRLALAGWLVIDSAAILLAITAVVSTSTFERWMQEDAWVEWATFYSFVGAALLRLDELWRQHKKRPLDPWQLVAWTGVALFCVAVAGEEISWGQRLFAFQPPEIFLSRNYQQELNVHNLLKDGSFAGLDLDSRYLVAFVAGMYGVFLPGLVRDRMVRVARWAALLRSAAPKLAFAPGFAGIVAVSLAYPVDLTGEATEWVLGLLFLVDAAVARAPGVTLTARRNWLLVPVALVVGLALVTPPALDALLFGSDDERRDLAQAEVRLLRQDLSAAHLDKLIRKQRVHKRIFTAVRDGYFRFDASSAFLEGQVSPASAEDGPRVLRDRRGYFLDPWNNPYWVESLGRRGTVLVYSMGPNRRRDTELDARLTPNEPFGGDDIGVEFPLPTAPPAGD